ncbi:hypothetical protein OS493_001237 [Desmophyllum pertusum]|uniref:G-protein coupled receptors family 1 profile domain-containing protein n=1 Tax=Desmophyllum pertusum TaxID=174260 RepID=A0A9W9ZUD1_9CNID|nr:hypothetical protein OS493_001237 [Desmophyllum pertusum]
MNDSYNSTAAGGTNLPGKFIPEPFGMTVARLTLFGIVFLAAVIGNFFVFTASFRNRRLRTFSYCLITNLAISDFVSMFWVPFLLVNEQLNAGWIYGTFLCRFINPTQVVCGLVTTNVHVAIAIDRYFSIVRGRLSKSCNHSRYRRARVIVPLVWIVAVVCSLPTYIFRELYSLTLKSGEKIEFCLESFPLMEDSKDGYRQMYSVFLFFVNYVIPISVSTALYGKIILHLKKTKLERKKLGRKFSQRNSATSKDAKVCSNNLTELEKRFISMAIIIVMIFFFCYLPYQVVFLLAEFADYATSWPYLRILMSVVYFLTWLPNALNPICYGAMDQRYAKAFRMICLSFKDNSDSGSKNQTGSLSRAHSRRLTEEL